MSRSSERESAPPKRGGRRRSGSSTTDGAAEAASASSHPGPPKPRPATRGRRRRLEPQTEIGLPTADEIAARPPLPGGRRLGVHLPLGSGMVKAVDRAHAIGATALQVFADNPTAWKRRAEPPRELPAFRRRLEELDVGPLAIHAAYLVNLAGPDPDFFERSIEVLRRELEMGAAYGARFVNVHIGSHRGTGVAEGARRVAEALERVLDGSPSDGAAPLLVLENSSGAGAGLGATVQEFAAVFEAAAALGVDVGRLALCLDTAHLWGAGYAIDCAEGVEALLDEVDARLGVDRVAMVHLNDSKAALGSHADRHEHVGAGQIGPEGMRAILSSPRLAAATYYIETPGMDEGYDALNIARAHDIVAGRDLTELPVGAADVRPSRASVVPEE